jgi:chaperonin cofactor prefoldin
MGVERADQIIKVYSPVAEDIDEALCNMDTENAKLRSEVGRLMLENDERVDQLNAALEKVERLEKALTEQRRRMGAEFDELQSKFRAAVNYAERLAGLFELHNLLPFLAKGECQCDTSVGMAPCESCAAREILNKRFPKAAQPAPDAAADDMAEMIAACDEVALLTPEGVVPVKPAPERPAKPAGGGK